MPVQAGAKAVNECNAASPVALFTIGAVLARSQMLAQAGEAHAVHCCGHCPLVAHCSPGITHTHSERVGQGRQAGQSGLSERNTGVMLTSTHYRRPKAQPGWQVLRGARPGLL